MSPGDADSLLQQGILAAKAKDRAEARRLLSIFLMQNPTSEKGWLWLAAVVETREQQRDCLSRVLVMNPEHPQAKAGLALLETAEMPDVKASSVEQVTPEEVRTPPPETSTALIPPAHKVRKESPPPVEGEINGISLKLGQQGQSVYPEPGIDDDITINRFFASIGETPPSLDEDSSQGVPSADSGPGGKLLAFRARAKSHSTKSQFEPYAVTGNGTKLLARHIRTGEFALYSSAPEYVSRDSYADKLTEKGLIYYRTPAVLTNTSLDKFVEKVGGLPEGEAVELILNLCDRLLSYYASSKAGSWLRTGTHGPHDIIVNEHGDFEPNTGFIDAPLQDEVLAFLPPEFGKPSQQDQRADVYTLSATLYFLLTGEVDRLAQYRSRGRALLFQQYGQTFHDKLSGVLERGLALAPNRRFPDVASFREALLELHRLYFPPLAWKPFALAGLVVALAITLFLLFGRGNSAAVTPTPVVGQASPTASSIPATPVATATVPELTTAPPAILTEATGGLLPTTLPPAPSSQSTPAGPDRGRLLLQQASLKDGQLMAYFGVVGRDNRPLNDVKSSGLRLFLDSREVLFFKLDQVDPATDPVTILFVLDSSSNMPDAYLERVKTGLSGFVNGLGSKDQVGLVRYTDHPEMAVDISEDKARLVEGLKPVQAGGTNATLDALVFATEQLKGRSGRKAIVLLTAGADTFSPVTQPSFLAEQLLDSDANLYVLGYRNGNQSATIYRQLAELSGGFYAGLSEDSQLSEGLASLNTLLSHAFKVTYNFNPPGTPTPTPPPTPVPPQRHRLTLQLSLDEALYVSVKQFEQ